MPRRLRARLDRLEGNAHATMNQAQELIGAMNDLVEDVADGVEFVLVRNGDASLMDFFTGKINELPITVRAKIREG